MLATGGGDATAAGVNFQQSLGALFGLWMLTDAPVDRRLQVGGAKITEIRMETEAPLDDALAMTSDGGVIAAQAKSTLSLSENLTSEFGQTVDQIVRQWLLSQNGDGSLGWNRPLNQTKDRFVIAVGPGSPATTRIHLAKALEARRQPGRPILTDQETKALEKFDACVRAAWRAATTEPLTEEELLAISGLTFLLPLDPEGADRNGWAGALTPALVSQADAPSVLNLLERIAGDLMSNREGRTLVTLRSDLMGRGARLTARPDFRDDIAALTAYSLQTEKTLAELEVIEAEKGARVGITRRCQSAVNAAAVSGHLLLIGEPGAGKSAVLNSLGRTLRAKGHDVVQLAVDGFSVESLEGLGHALGLQHEVPTVLGAWDGPEPAFLLIDALDASRGGSGEAAFKRLIQSVIELDGRWTVVASIRTFDLRLGQNLRTLFKGTPPESTLHGDGFANVRHVQVPPWSKEEFDDLLGRTPRLAKVLQHTTEKLRELAMVPFNTRLLADLLADGAIGQDFSAVDSQIALLNLYWDRRVNRHGVAAEVCLRSVVQEMVANRALRAQRLKVAAANPNALDALTADGVLVLANGERSVQFRHHLLFDYVASRAFLDADAVVDGSATFPKAEGLGLTLAPAMGFLLQSLWSDDADHHRFWTGIRNLLSAPDCDPVIRSIAARMAAELPITAEDIDAFARAINTGAPTATTALPHVAGAVAVRLEDAPGTPLAPWVNLMLQLSARPAEVVGVLRVLGHMLISRVQDPALRADLGSAVRALLEHGYSLDETRILATPAIGLVADTIETDVNASVALLRTALTDDRFDRFAPEEVPALARRINAIATASPAFAVEIYECAFRRQVTDDRPTSMGFGRILNITSNARQDFESARWSLKEYFPSFLAASPAEATQALLSAMAGYVARVHPDAEGTSTRTFLVQGTEVHLQPDYSRIWAYEVHPSYARDADELLSIFVTWLETSNESAVLAAAEHAIRHGRLAVVWSRLFMVAAARGGLLAEKLLSYAVRPEFLITLDTRKDAIDLVAAQYDALPEVERRSLEAELLDHPFEGFAQPDAAKEAFLRRLFGTIGAHRLATDAARAVVAEAPDRATSNDRLNTIRPLWDGINDDDWLNQEPNADPFARDTIDALASARHALRLDIADQPVESLPACIEALAGIKGRLDSGAITENALVQLTESTFGQGVHKLITSDHVSAETPDKTVAQLANWVEETSRFTDPEVHEDPDVQFECLSSWNPHSARFKAAEAALDLCNKRPETYPSLAPLIDRMLTDPHPAVRMKAATRLVRIWDIDRPGFWERAKRLIETEHNFGVLDLFITQTLERLVGQGEDRNVANLVLPLIDRYPAARSRSEDFRTHLVQVTVQFWVRLGFEDAAQLVRNWFAATVDNVDDVVDAIQWLRGDCTIGLRGDDNPTAAARRAIAIGLVGEAVGQAADALADFNALIEPSEAEIGRARDAMKVVDMACLQLYFSSGAPASCDVQNHSSMTIEGKTILLKETAPILRRIGEQGGPNTVLKLHRLLEYLVEADPPGVFDLIAFAALKGGKQSGYHLENLAADLMVKLVGRYLADHKDLFADPVRRTALVDMLEIFSDAGWPPVRRLFYRLPDLLH